MLNIVVIGDVKIAKLTRCVRRAIYFSFYSVLTKFKVPRFHWDILKLVCIPSEICGHFTHCQCQICEIDSVCTLSNVWYLWCTRTLSPSTHLQELYAHTITHHTAIMKHARKHKHTLHELQRWCSFWAMLALLPYGMDSSWNWNCSTKNLIALLSVRCGFPSHDHLQIGRDLII